MNNKKAKRLRKTVMLAMYAGDGVTAADVRKGKHDVMQQPEFKRVFRARKRNESKHRPEPNMVSVLLGEDLKLKELRRVRLKKDKLRKQEILMRKYR